MVQSEALPPFLVCNTSPAPHTPCMDAQFWPSLCLIKSSSSSGSWLLCHSGGLPWPESGCEAAALGSTSISISANRSTQHIVFLLRLHLPISLVMGQPWHTIGGKYMQNE